MAQLLSIIELPRLYSQYFFVLYSIVSPIQLLLEKDMTRFAALRAVRIVSLTSPGVCAVQIL